MPQIIPAILTNDLADYKNKLAQIENLVSTAQIDIMDNLFVPNISVEIKDLISLKTKLNLEAHLMIKNPEAVFPDCEKAGFRRVIFHFEAADKIQAVLNAMQKFKFKKGIALNPETPIKKILPYLEKIDVVLFLMVTPGFYGSPFQPKVLDKIKKLKKIIKLKNLKTKIEADGGVNLKNIPAIAKAGADDIVVGSAIFHGDNIAQNISALKTKLKAK